MTFLLLMLIAVPVSAKFLRLDRVVALGLLPLIFIVWNVVFHNLSVFLGQQRGLSVEYRTTSLLAAIIWIIFHLSCVVCFRRKRLLQNSVFEKISLPTLKLLCTSSISLLAWLIGIGSSFRSPADPDALSNAFISTRFLTQTNQNLCTISNDVSEQINLRFEACGTYVLSRASNFFGVLTNDELLNISFLLVAFFLPIAAATSWIVLTGRKEESWIAGASSLVFLLYPYGLNGLMRYSLGLCFLLALIGFTISQERRPVGQSVLIAMSLVGLGYIHLSLALVFVLLFTISSVIFCLFDFASEQGFRNRLLKTIQRSSQFLVVLPAIIVFGSISSVRVSGTNVVNANVELQKLNPSFARKKPTSGITFFTHFETVTAHLVDACRALIFSNEWTRPQPVLSLIGLLGLFILIRTKKKSGMIFITFFLILATLYWFAVLLDRKSFIFDFLFLGNWYRLLALTQTIFVIPLAFGVVALFARFKDGRSFYAVRFTAIAVFTLSITTGASIVNTAWEIERPLNSQALKEMSVLDQFKNSRTLNDPSDGSSWAYSRAGLLVTSPNDRDEAVPDGRILREILERKDEPRLCALIEKYNATAVIGVGKNTSIVRRLDDLGWIETVPVNQKSIVFGTFRESLLNSCKKMKSSS